MAYRLIYTSSFESEYDAIIAYLIEDLGSPKAAKHLADEMDRAGEMLADKPLANALSRKPSLNKLELREHLVNNYVVVYRIEDEDVYLLHMFHQTQNFEDRLSR